MLKMDINRKTPPPGFEPQYITPPPLKDGPRQILSLALDAAGRCNLACRYCAETVTLPKRGPMSAHTLDAAWRFLFPGGAEPITQAKLRKDSFSIHMGSGEPLLNLPLLKKLAAMLEQARSAGNEIPGVFLVTNGTLLDEEIMEWLIASGWNVKLSLDGPAAIHDRWRVLPGGEGTHHRVVKAVAYMAERMPGRFSVCAVLCRGNDPAAVFSAIERLGVRQIDMVPVASVNDSIKPGSEDIENYRKFVIDYAARFLEDEGMNSNTASPPALTVFNQCMLRLMGYKLSRIYCSAGRSYLGVGPNGGLYPCTRFVGVDRYRLGHLDTGLDPGAAEAFRNGPGRPYERRESCTQCWAAPLCGGPCFACAEMFGPGSGEPIDFHCAYLLATAEAALSLFNRLREQNPERLLPFMSQSSDKIFEMFD
jgi:uncharacterized protein